MKAIGIGVVALAALLSPALASACDGVGGRDVAVTMDSQKITVTNTGREWVLVTFGAFGNTYNFQLAPGQSDSPRSPGMFGQPMYGYQSCVATPLPVASSGVSGLRSGP